MGVDRCTGENCAADAEKFESDLSESASNDRTNSFAFIAQYSPVGFVRADEVDSPELNKKIVYVYRMTRDSIDHTEFPADEMKSRYGTDNLGDLLVWNTLMHVLER
jgi:membrane-bound lytic murein transglycosylase